jgi:primosomal protein N' (replication factor Y)
MQRSPELSDFKRRDRASYVLLVGELPCSSPSRRNSHAQDMFARTTCRSRPRIAEMMAWPRPSRSGSGKLLFRQGSLIFKSQRFRYHSYLCPLRRGSKVPALQYQLVYHFKDKILSCHYCNFKTSPPSICPECNSGYIRYSGLGTERIESELSRIFPQAKPEQLSESRRRNPVIGA